MRMLQLFFVLILVVSLANATITFKNGRRRGGNVLIPDDTVKVTDDVLTRWFKQKLDHFQPTDNRTWQQQYFLNDEFYNYSNKSPVFLMIDGEGPSSPRSLERGSWYDSARQFGALMFQLEHRFYGKSHPTEDLSTENLKYLSSQQALQDVAAFITAMKKKYRLTDEQKWIVFGGSYAGSLAAWLRLQFPHLVDGAVSSSGPLLAKTDFVEYFQVVEDAFRTNSDECADAIKDAFKKIEELEQTTEGRLLLDGLFSLCVPLENLVRQNEKNVVNLLETLADKLASVVQYNRIVPGSWSISDTCSEMEFVEEEPIQRLSDTFQFLLTRDEPCVAYNYDTMIKEMQQVSWDSSVAEGMRQWIYQTCTEFGWYQTTSQKSQIFGSSLPLNFFTDQCAEIYGPDFDVAFINRAVNNTNTVYGALEIEESKVVYVHGTVDPWHPMGITETRHKNAPAILIEGTAHCANMGSERGVDSPQLIEAREQVNKLIKKWLKD